MAVAEVEPDASNLPRNNHDAKDDTLKMTTNIF